MSENTPEPAAQPEPQNEPAAAEADATDWKAEARKWEQRAKENKTAVRELEMARQATMTEAEKAVAEAEQRGRTAALTDFGKRLARTEFDAAAARRNPDVDTGKVLEYLDLSRFVTDDGEPDRKAISAAVERLIPAAQAQTAGSNGFDLGNRGGTAASNNPMNELIRRQAGR